jgi:malonyl CoA-acyl carrier protein transacylase
MANKILLSNVLSNRKPIFGYNPPGIENCSLAKAVSENGGIGLVDLQRLSNQQIDGLLQNTVKIKGYWGIKVTSINQLQDVLTKTQANLPKIIIFSDCKPSEEIKNQLYSQGIALLSEVVSLEEAYQHKWASGFLVKGEEAAGRIGKKASFILAQQFASSGLPFILQGGIGYHTIGAAFTAGAEGVVMDSQLYLTDESPLSEKVKEFLRKIDATDTQVLGKAGDYQYRVYAKLGTMIVRQFIKKEKEWLALGKEKFTQKVKSTLKNDHNQFNSEKIANSIIPLGQDVAFASHLTEKFSTVEKMIDGLLEQAEKQLIRAKKNYPFITNSTAAQVIGSKLPIIQGPMANVSENPKFAKAVAEEGGLPFLALGSLFEKQTRTLVSKTEKEIGDLPFGCGIIGLEANASRLEKHLEIIKEKQPPFVVVAAGTINQAKTILSYGVDTFLHTPSPRIFAEAIDVGIDKLVLEGSECGGHIGFLNSFVLWELSLAELKQKEAELKSKKEKINVAFAGGIGDKYSAAMVATIASSLPDLMDGIMWVGTAYILTKEIIDTGAIKPLYQELALNAQETMVLGETVNTQARSIPTPFAKKIIEREYERIEKGVPLKERKKGYEDDNLGATRIAAQGEIWNPEGEDDKPNRFMPVDEETQYQKGNYLIGQIVGSLRTTKTIKDLHYELTELSSKIAKESAKNFAQKKKKWEKGISTKKKMPLKAVPPQQKSFQMPTKGVPAELSTLGKGEAIAIVGLGCVLPDANNVNELWENVKNKHYSIKEIPPERWSNAVDVFYHEDKSVPNKSYCKLAATVKGLKFNSIEFKMPPAVADHIDDVQKWALIAAKEALEDANIIDDNEKRERTAVIVGNSMGGEIRIDHTRQIFLQEIIKSLEALPTYQNLLNQEKQQKIRQELINYYNEFLPDINEDSMPGELSNIIAGRIANTFNLRGKSMTTDAACASSLAALSVAIDSLLKNESDVVLCGGADRSLGPTTFVKFCKIGALSNDGSFPFDARANGFVMGEGSGFCVLKRLSDAIKDDDKIYAVIRGFGASSDGKGKGITAPNPIGQKLAINRALEQAQIQLSDLQLIEAHGTSTSIGDLVELQVLNDMGKGLPTQSIPLTSLKSNIGHLKAAAGISSLIRTALAVHKKKLPPSLNFEEPNPKIDWDSSPFYVNTQYKDWKAPKGKQRYAGVSAFGFGGTNYHVVLEEYQPQKTEGVMPRILTKDEREQIQKILQGAVSTSFAPRREEWVLDQEAWQEAFKERAILETEALFIGGNSNAELKRQLELLQNEPLESTFAETGTGMRVRDFAYNTRDALQEKNRIGFACQSLSDIPQIATDILKSMDDPAKRKFLQNKGVFYSQDHDVKQVAFLFPGQGSQYVYMARELYEKYSVVQETFEEADEATQELMGFKISEIIFAKNATPKEIRKQLMNTEITQPAIFVVDIAIFRLMKELGITPDYVAGHSLGEYAALVASGILTLKEGLMAVIPRGRAMSKYSSRDKGLMASVGADYRTVDKILKQIDGYVISANKNSPKQTVISGSTPAVKEAEKLFKEKGINFIILPVSAAFHSKIVEAAVETLRESLEKIDFKKPSIPISSNVTGEMYPETPQEMIDLLCEQVCSPVEWIKQMESLYDKGVRTFIEIGPKYVLTSFARAILHDKDDVLALASIHPKRGELRHFNEVLAALGASKYPLELPSPDSEIYTEEFKYPTTAFYHHQPIEPLEAYSSSGLVSSEETAAYQKLKPFEALLTNELETAVTESTFKKYLELQGSSISAFLHKGYETYKETIAPALQLSEEMKRLDLITDPIGVTGVSIGLPGKDRKVFSESNFDDILAGKNFIEKIPMEIRNKMVDKNIYRLVKDAVKGAQFQTISDVNKVIKLAAQKGSFDLTEEYGVNEKLVDVLDSTFQLAIAAGIEALRDAGIPLTPLKVKTTVGKELTKGWALHESIRDTTGIVFASAFPGYSNLISIISEHLSDKYKTEKHEEFVSFFDSLLEQISNDKDRQKIEKWFGNQLKELEDSQESRFQFTRKFLFEILSMGHSQFAQFIKARGPNTQVNAACSSTNQAIAIAEDWIRNNRCSRVIVIGADDVTNEQMLEWIASGFLAVGAASTDEKVEDAALPFDKRRHGMIIGMGAVGMVLESKTAYEERGVKPITDLLGTHIVNSAYHGTRLDRNHISSQMDKFISTMERRYNLSRDQVAEKMVFVSHETYTPARGGSASAEVDALRKTFGDKVDDIIVSNTKGFTGHAMGAGIEDIMAVKMLQAGIVPPIANFKEQDPELGYLNLSKGQKYDIQYALRFAAGFGSQLTMAFFRLNTPNNRFDSPKYDEWLHSLGGSRETLQVEKKTLQLAEDPNIIQKPIPSPAKTKAASGTTNAPQKIVQSIICLISEKTGYPTEMIEPNMHLEEDLGIDTVKSAELFGILREQHNLPREEGVRIQDYYSVNKIAEYIASRIATPGEVSANVSVTKQIAKSGGLKAADTVSPKTNIVKDIIELIAEKTGYPPDMIEPDMELEEDLGIDTVKQAEIFGQLRTQYDLPREEGIRIQDYSTVTKIAQYVSSRLQKAEAEGKGSEQAIETQEDDAIAEAPLQRRILEIVNAPLPPSKPLDLTDKKFILVGRKDKFRKQIKSKLKAQGSEIADIIDTFEYSNEEQLQQALPETEIDGLVFIQPKTDSRNHHQRVAREFFVLCRYLKFVEKPTILVINNLTPLFGWEQKVSSGITGALTGFTKSLAREFKNGKIKAIACSTAEQVMQELQYDDTSLEVLYDKEGKRKTIITPIVPIKSDDTESFTPTSEDLFLIAGGAQGITYEITKGIAENFKTNLALLGRTILPKNVKELAALDEKGLAEEKQQLLQKLKTENERVTPVMLERQWRKITKALNVYYAIQELTSLGAKVEYYSVDVTEEQPMKEVIEKIEKDFKKPITVIVHAAGLESSKLIHDKKLSDFNRVYNVKALGLDNLLKYSTKKHLKRLICFSSVAGRYGNAGQVDYSAANDYLNKTCWKLQEEGINATAICWSAWKSVGMATRGSVMKVLKMAGVTPVSIEEGTQAFLQELQYGQEPEVVVAGNLGVLLGSPLPAVEVDKKIYPIAGKIKRTLDGIITAERVFAVEKDLYLDNHRFDEVPFLPGVMGLEWFTELAKIAFPNKTISGFEEVQFQSAVKFHKDKSQKLIAEVIADEQTGIVNVKIISYFIKDGKRIGKPTVHFVGKVLTGKTSKKRIELPEIAKNDLIERQEIYQVLSHGELFQVLKGINKLEKTIVVRCKSPNKKQLSYDYNELIGKPLAIESGFQSMAFIDLINKDKMGLPYAIEKLTFQKAQNEDFLIIGSKVGSNEIGSIYDFDVVTSKGDVILSVERYSTVNTEAIAKTPMLEKLRLRRIKQLFDLPKDAHLEAISVQETADEIARDPSILDNYLHEKEITKHQSLKVDKRRNEWLAGVIAAKKAIKKIYPETQYKLFYIEKDKLGKPIITIDGAKKPLNITITHSNGYALAAASEKETIGIDLEKIENFSSALVDELLDNSEKELIQKTKGEIASDLITKIWTAKEAVTKVLGVGLNIDLHALRISEVEDELISIVLDAQRVADNEHLNKELFKKNKSIHFPVRIRQNDEFVGALCSYRQ